MLTLLFPEQINWFSGKNHLCQITDQITDLLLLVPTLWAWFLPTGCIGGCGIGLWFQFSMGATAILKVICAETAERFLVEPQLLIHEASISCRCFPPIDNQAHCFRV
ncbi:hypothetical protein ACWPKS_04405 [Coraliomargarita sp. W4R72]